MSAERISDSVTPPTEQMTDVAASTHAPREHAERLSRRLTPPPKKVSLGRKSLVAGHEDNCRYAPFPSLNEFEEDDEDDGAANRSSYFTLAGLPSMHRARRIVKRLVQHHLFDTSIGLIIIANAACIALEQHCKLSNIDAPSLGMLEQAFVCIYTVELILRLFVGSLARSRGHWICFELLLVGIAIAHLIHDNHFGGDMLFFELVQIARLARLFRFVRLTILFRELWLLVNGLLASVGVMFYTCVLFGFILFTFALFGVELIAMKHFASANPDPLVAAVVEEYFPNLMITMLTLLQFVTLDSIGSIYRPLIKDDPALVIYFGSLILITGIVLQQLITAVLVKAAMERAEQDKEAAQVHAAKQKKRMVKEIRALFAQIDEDQSGTLDLQEILGNSDAHAEFVHSYIKDADLEAVFSYLDIDGDGELDIEEFCEGLYQAVTSQTPLEFKRIDKRVEAVRQQVLEMADAQSTLMRTVSRLSDKMEAVAMANGIPKVPRASMATQASKSTQRFSSQSVECPLAQTKVDSPRPESGNDIWLELRQLRMDLKIWQGLDKLSYTGDVSPELGEVLDFPPTFPWPDGFGTGGIAQECDHPIVKGHTPAAASESRPSFRWQRSPLPSPPRMSPSTSPGGSPSISPRSPNKNQLKQSQVLIADKGAINS